MKTAVAKCIGTTPNGMKMIAFSLAAMSWSLSKPKTWRRLFRGILTATLVNASLATTGVEVHSLNHGRQGRAT
jgi:hypothetical protein